GMSVAVVTKDEILFQKGFGKTAVDDGQVVDEHTLFAIASTTKAMVVAGILMLVDEEKLSLDDPIITHIPELHFENPMLTQQLMVRDLLAHRTGLPSTDFWSFLQNMPLEEQLSRLRNVPMAAPLRDRLIYQNTMFEIAGLLIERLSGQRWHNFLTGRLWQPIGMLETYGERAQIGAGQSHVTPYQYFEDRLIVADWDFPADYADAAGSAWSSIHDMSLWAQFLLRDGVTSNGERLVSEAGMQQMFEPQQLASASDFYPTVELTKPNWRSYGLAWFQQDFQGRKIDFHTGSLSGLIAIIGLDRAADKAVIVLGNRDHAEMRHALMWEVMDNSEADKRRDWNQEVFDLYAAQAEEGKQSWKEAQKHRLKHTKPSLAAAAYAGRYSNPSFGDIQIDGSGSHMTLKTTLVDFEMSHWHLDTYLVEYKTWEMHEFATFNIDPRGSITSLSVFGETFGRVAAE
ncbi:MAG: serine hydrolase, partial [Xanthomonadales bacterium]|nr:serine hydrolase [Xanthomonadales bacterium]